jgi:hypothetical protein
VAIHPNGIGFGRSSAQPNCNRMKTRNRSRQFFGHAGTPVITHSAVGKFIGRKIFLAVFAFLFFQASGLQATIYITADDLAGTNLFGTLDPTTGQFTQIGTTDPVLLGLTTGKGGVLFGADVNTGNLFTVSKSGATAQYGTVTAPSAFYGLAYSHASGNFFADNLDPNSVTLYSIAGDGESSSLVGPLAGPNSGFFPTGNLAFGPGGKLYFNYSSDLVNGSNSTLYTVDTSTGVLTAIGSGMGTDILALFYDGKNLYGVDSFVTSGIGVFQIDTGTGVATQVSTVAGLPNTDSFFVDAATRSVPEMGSTATLFILALTVIVVGSGRARSAPSVRRGSAKRRPRKVES